VLRPARVLAVSGALIAAGVLVGGTAYAASQAQPADETYVACVNIATGAMRLIDPRAGHACRSEVGPTQERQISWSRTAGGRGPQGPAGPRGPRGEAGDDGDDGQLSQLEDLDGVRCTSGGDTGRVEVSVQSPERGSGIQLICLTDDTVITPPNATPAPPERPTRPQRPTRPEPTTEPPTAAPTEGPDEPDVLPDPDAPDRPAEDEPSQF
jgi:cell division septation protein DedD